MWLTVKRWPSEEGHVQNRERKCESRGERRRNVSFYHYECVKFVLLLNANFSINPFHANL